MTTFKKSLFIVLFLLGAGALYAGPNWSSSVGVSGVGSTDNSCIRADGTGGNTIQGTTTNCTIADNGVISAGGFETSSGTVRYSGSVLDGGIGLVTYNISASTHAFDVNAADTTAFSSLIRIRPQNASTSALVLKAHASQGVHLLDVVNSSDATIAFINKAGGIKPVSLTADPCADTTGYPPGTLFYNSTSGYFCFCNNSNADVKTVDDTTACF